MRSIYNMTTITAVVLFVSCGTTMVQAADPLAEIPVTQRQFDSFRAKGLVIEALTLKPSLGTGVAYTDNVYQAEHHKQSDKIIRITPVVAGEMPMGAGSNLSFDLQGDYFGYRQADERNHTDYRARVGYTLPVTGGADVVIGGELGRNHEDYSLSTAASGVTVMPVRSDYHTVFARFILKPARFVWEAGLAHTVKRFRDGRSINSGTTVVQRDRDYRDVTADVKLRYKTGGAIESFFGIKHHRLDYDRRNYVAGSGFAGVDQDRHRTDVTAGFDFAPTGKWRGRVTAGYGYESMADSALDSQGSGLFGLDLTYLYSPLTNMSLGFDRFFSDDTDSAQGVIETRLSAGIIHELTRQWIVNADFAFVHRYFQDGERDETTRGAVGAIYHMNRHMRLSGGVTHTDRGSNRQNGDFSETQAMLHLESAF